MSRTIVREVFNDTVAAGSTTSINVPLADYELMGVLVVMTDATASTDIDSVDLKFYDAAKPLPILTNLPLTPTTTIGPSLTGARAESFSIFSISCLVEGEVLVVNGAAAPRNLEVYTYKFSVSHR